jgi:hypothetical protein
VRFLYSWKRRFWATDVAICVGGGGVGGWEGEVVGQRRFWWVGVGMGGGEGGERVESDEVA